jgi:sigma-B regulation protein RsbU (phosphoserine phosphatase)
MSLQQELALFRERMEHELTLAARVQRSLLPSALPEIEGVEFVWDLQPCTELAGDVLNVIQLDQRHVAMYVLDVSGHGVSAALLSAQLCRLLTPDTVQSQLLRRRLDATGDFELTPPLQVVDELNRLFPMNRAAPQYFTLLYGVLDVESGRFRFTSAGHPGPVHRQAGTGAREIEVAGTPVGLLDRGSWSENVVEIGPGDALILYSDGITEALNDRQEMFGVGRLLGVIDQHGDSDLHSCCDRILAELESWRGGDQRDDDYSLLMVQRG